MISYEEWVVEDVNAAAFSAPLQPEEEVGFCVLVKIYHPIKLLCLAN
jgi:hypothetical protein